MLYKIASYTIMSFITWVAIIACNAKKAGTMNANVAAVSSASPEKNYAAFCAGCHGEKMDAFVDRKWVHGTSSADLFKAVKYGYHDEGMPGFDSAFTDKQIQQLADYMLTGIANVKRYAFTEKVVSNIFKSEGITIRLDTIATGMSSPWGIAFLPNNDMLVTDKNGKMFRITPGKEKFPISGVPEVVFQSQGGLLDVTLHPNYATNHWIYISYSKGKKDANGKIVATTAVTRAVLNGDALTEQKIIFEALPYAATRIHYGSRFAWGKDGMLYITVGERGNEKENPQSLERYLGKIHRIKDDGSIPADNPFVNIPGAVPSIFTYGNRNPQGMTVHPATGDIWTNEHGPRGGDEINIVKKGANYGWPVISYGINYDGRIMTKLTAKAGMEQPLHYWIPSIGPSGMAFVQGDKYKAWKGNVFVGAMRFKYLNRCVLKGEKVIHEEILFKNIGRVRDIRMAPDGFLYMSVEAPGIIYKLVPVEG